MFTYDDISGAWLMRHRNGAAWTEEFMRLATERGVAGMPVEWVRLWFDLAFKPETFEIADPYAAIKELMDCWNQTIGGRALVADFVAEADERVTERLVAICGVGGKPSSGRIGKMISKFSGRIVDGKKFEAVAMSGGRVLWELIDAPQILLHGPEGDFMRD